MDNLKNAWNDGYQAWIEWGNQTSYNGLRPDNPYDCEDQPELWDQWETGFDDAGWDS